MCRDFARREYSRWSRKIDPFISLSSFSLFLLFFLFFLVCISRTGEPVGIRTGSANLGLLLLFFSSLGRQRAEDLRLARSLQASFFSSLSFLFSTCFCSFFAFLFSSLCRALLPTSSLARSSSSLYRYPVSPIILLCLFIHLCYVTDTFI